MEIKYKSRLRAANMAANRYIQKWLVFLDSHRFLVWISSVVSVFRSVTRLLNNKNSFIRKSEISAALALSNSTSGVHCLMDL